MIILMIKKAVIASLLSLLIMSSSYGNDLQSVNALLATLKTKIISLLDSVNGLRRDTQGSLSQPVETIQPIMTDESQYPKATSSKGASEQPLNKIPHEGFSWLNMVIILDRDQEENEMQEKKRYPAMGKTVQDVVNEKQFAVISSSVLNGCTFLPRDDKNPLTYLLNPHEKWSVYMTPGNEFTLLVWNNQKTLTELGLNDTILRNIDTNNIESNLKSIKNKTTDINLLKLLFLPQQNPAKCIYLTGHGGNDGYNDFIANLLFKEYEELLRYFEDIGCKFLAVSTCYFAGSNLLEAHKKLFGNYDLFQQRFGLYEDTFFISYPIYLEGIIDAPTYKVKKLKFEKFFTTINQFFEVRKGTDIQHWITQPFKKIWECLSEGTLENVAQIMLPGSRQSFQALNVDDTVKVINYPQLIAHELEARIKMPLHGLKSISKKNNKMDTLKKVSSSALDLKQLLKDVTTDKNKSRNKTAPLIINAQKTALVLLYPSVLKVPLKFTNQKSKNFLTRIVSMIPGSAQASAAHYIEELDLQNIEIEKYSILKILFSRFPKERSSKLFFIENCIFSNSVQKNMCIYSHPGYLLDMYLIDSTSEKITHIYQKEKDSQITQKESQLSEMEDIFRIFPISSGEVAISSIDLSVQMATGSSERGNSFKKATKILDKIEHENFLLNFYLRHHSKDIIDALNAWDYEKVISLIEQIPSKRKNEVLDRLQKLNRFAFNINQFLFRLVDQCPEEKKLPFLQFFIDQDVNFGKMSGQYDSREYLPSFLCLLAAYKENLPMLQLLLKKVPSQFTLEAVTEFSDQPLHIAARLGNYEGVGALIKAGATLSIKDTHGYTPLNWAKIYKHKEIEKLLIKAGGREENIDYVKIQKQISWDENASKIFEKLETWDYDGFQSILKSMPPKILEFAPSSLYIQLLDKKINKNLPDLDHMKRKQCPAKKRLMFLKSFIDNGLRPNRLIDMIYKQYKITFLGQIAMYKENIWVLDFLINNKFLGREKASLFNINIEDEQKRTPLHWGVLSNNTDIIQQLLDAGADPSITDTKNKTPLDYARSKNLTHTITIFEKFIASQK